MTVNNIKVERARIRMTQAELAEALGVSQASIVTWEQDCRSCSTAKFVDMCNIFGVSLDYLYGLTDRRERNL